jgi:uncharacterized protein YacL
MWKFVAFVFVLSALASGLYIATLGHVSNSFVETSLLLATTSTFIVWILRVAAAKRSSEFVLHLLFSAVAGLGIATFCVVCSKFLFDASVPEIVSLHMRFLLPLVFGTAFFWGTKTCSWFVPSETVNQPTGRRFIPDLSVLEDGRIVDLARLGLFDGRLFFPACIFDELRMQAESGDEHIRMRARKALDSIRRLESLAKIEFRVENCPPSLETELAERVLDIALQKDAYVLTVDNIPTRIDENGTLISLDSIAHTLRPPIPKGEMLNIKIQRIGKEPKQGIGYLEDGTMVVVNGGGDFLGKTVRTQVLSQKYSSSGKIVFCNVKEDMEDRCLSPAPYLVSVDLNST